MCIAGTVGCVASGPVSAAEDVWAGFGLWSQNANWIFNLERREIAISAEASLGNGGDLNFGGGALRLIGSWSSSRAIRVNTSATINTAGFDATLNGLLLGAGSLTKNGNGTLTIASESPFSGGLTVDGGTVRLSGTSLRRTSLLSANTGGQLLLDNSGLLSNDRAGDGATVTLNRGELALTGNAAADVSEALDTIAIGAAQGSGTVTLRPAGGTGTRLRLRALTLNRGEVVIRGGALDAPAGGTFSRVILPNSTPQFPAWRPMGSS